LLRICRAAAVLPTVVVTATEKSPEPVLRRGLDLARPERLRQLEF
jgi:hypothetical protein